MHILPPLPMSLWCDCRVSAQGFDIPGNIQNLAENKEESSGVPNVPVVAKWLPFTRPSRASGAGAGNSITNFWNVMKHSHHHSCWAAMLLGRTRTCRIVGKRKEKVYLWGACPRQTTRCSQPLQTQSSGGTVGKCDYTKITYFKSRPHQHKVAVGKDHCNFHHTKKLIPATTKELLPNTEQKTNGPREIWGKKIQTSHSSQK